MPSLFLCLYKRRGATDYHWALAPHQETDATAPYNPTNFYQIGTYWGNWFTNHGSGFLGNAKQFVGCVKLPPVEFMDYAELTHRINALSATPPVGYSMYRGVAWSCVEWVLVLLQQLAVGGHINIDLQGFVAMITGWARQMQNGTLGVVYNNNVRVVTPNWS
jgi:hypothetical protein